VFGQAGGAALDLFSIGGVSRIAGGAVFGLSLFAIQILAVRDDQRQAEQSDDANAKENQNAEVDNLK
jgi:hypothetical protein